MHSGLAESNNRQTSRFLWYPTVVVFCVGLAIQLLCVFAVWPAAQRSRFANFSIEDSLLYSTTADTFETKGLLYDGEDVTVRDRVPLYPLIIIGIRRVAGLVGCPELALETLTNALARMRSRVLFCFAWYLP